MPPWVEPVISLVVALKWPVAIVVAAALLRSPLITLFNVAEKARVKGKVGGAEIEGELERVKTLEAPIAAAIAETNATDVVASTGPPTGEPESDSAATKTDGPPPDDAVNRWTAYYDETERSVIALAAQSPKAALAYAISQTEMVLARREGWDARFAVLLPQVLPIMRADSERYDPNLVDYLEEANRFSVEQLAPENEGDQIMPFIGFWAKLPRIVGTLPPRVAATLKAQAIPDGKNEVPDPVYNP